MTKEEMGESLFLSGVDATLDLLLLAGMDPELLKSLGNMVENAIKRIETFES